jgi:hypothetical protein
MRRATFFRVSIAAGLCVIAGCSKVSAPGASSASSASSSTSATSARAGAWIKNGAEACNKYLTQDVLAALLTTPAGESKVLSPQACSYTTADSGGTITITLTEAGPAVFDAFQKYLVDPVPLPGVGDKASQSIIGIDAVKGNDRNCSIDAGGAPGSLKMHGAELGRKLGAICNQLFALP